MHSNGDEDSSIISIIPFEVPFREIKPNYGWYEDAVLSMRQTLAKKGINPNESNAESEELCTDYNSALQQIINYAIEEQEKRQQAVKKSIQINNGETV